MPKQVNSKSDSMKIFLTYTAVIEAFTGLGLIFFPTIIARILLNAELDGLPSILLAMVGGTAILSLACGAWLARYSIYSVIAIKISLLYNISVTLVLLFGVFKMGFGGIALWVVIVFHLVQTIISLLLFQKRA